MTDSIPESRDVTDLVLVGQTLLAHAARIAALEAENARLSALVEEARGALGELANLDATIISGSPSPLYTAGYGHAVSVVRTRAARALAKLEAASKDIF